MALGSPPRDILTLVVRRAMTPVAIGLAAGIAASIGVAQLLQALLFGVAPSDPAPVAIAAVFLTGVALAAAMIPARRATRINPLDTLRAD
ncbi:FtsX-like permease family protein [compost metagenome]